MSGDWARQIERALATSPGLETWSGHFAHRISELEAVSAFWPPAKVGAALEIGCGNGLAAVFFSPRAGRIVASDLAAADVHAHSIGLVQAKEFVQRMELGNVEILACSAESIPLPDASFDLVYGLYSLEHIPDRPRALREMHRVLRTNGEVLLTVPAFSWALFYPYEFYKELGKRVYARIWRKIFPPPATQIAGGNSAPAAVVTSASSFFQHYPHFPFPEPHGFHGSWPQELLYYRSANWRRLLQEAGFTQVSIEPISFVPSFFRPLLPGPMERGLERFLKNRRSLAGAAQFFCLRARRA